MEKIPTAEEFLYNKTKFGEPLITTSEVMIEFTKLYVEVALKEVANSQIATPNGVKDVFSGPYKSIILNAFPLSNIK